MLGAAMLGLGASQALAQPDAGSEVEEVVVTGSRIPQPNLTSVSPIQAVGSQEVLLGGRAETANVLNQLPQVNQSNVNGLSSTSNPLNGPGGVATVDLRGLGPQRTLVLVDGRRLGVGNPDTGSTTPAPDINQIPSQLIDRIEVLTGGASATYGSDAVAGVVNFIMKRNFEGVQIDAQFGAYQHNQHNELVQDLLRTNNPPIHVPGNAFDGKSRDLSVIFGLNAPDGRGNVTAYFTYHDQDPVVQNRRDWSSCQVGATGAGAPFCNGSPNSNIFYLSSGLGQQFSVLGNQFINYDVTANTTPPPRFNSNDYAYLLQQSTRYTAGFFANYEVSRHLELYSDFGFMDTRTNVQIAPTGLFQGSGVTASGGFEVNCNNPFLSAQQAGALGCTAGEIASGATKDLYIGRRNIEGGGRNSSYHTTNYRIVFGGRGEISGSWKYDLYGSYYYTSSNKASENYLSLQRIQNGLLVDAGPNGPVCRSGGGCVPYNIFQDGGVTPEAIDYLVTSGTERGSVTERIIEGTVTGDLGDYGVKSPWADDGVGVAFGFHHRRDHLEYQPDQAMLSGDLSGSGGASVTVDNSLRVFEGYAETRVPLIQGRDFVQDLTAEGGFRYSDYSTGIQAKTWKLGLQWSPTEDIRFRGSFQKAIRAPSIIELYTPATVTNTTQVSEDPCAQNAANPATLDQCLRTGITAAQFGVIPQCPAGQCAILNGGNTALLPETGKTFSVGFTTTPRFLPGFTASIDYYRIKLTGKITNIPLGVILQRCLESGDDAFCSQIVRASNGTLFGTSQAAGGYINGTLVNIGAGKNEGVDFQASYKLPLEDWGMDRFGGLSVSLVGAYLIKAESIPLPGDDAYDCAGLFGPQCDSVNPRWRHTLRLNWTTPWDATVSLAWRYMSGVKLERDTNEPTIGAGGNDAFNHTLPERSYVDLSGVWHVNDKLTVRAGVNNLFDQDPPLVKYTINGTGFPNSYPIYDLLGRQLFVGFTADF